MTGMLHKSTNRQKAEAAYLLDILLEVFYTLNYTFNSEFL